MKATLSVWWDFKLVGALRLDEHGDLSFAYDPAWLADASAAPLSASLPLQTEGVGDLRPLVHARSTRDQKPVLRGWPALNCAR